MQAGQFRHRIKFQNPPPPQDGGTRGQQSSNYKDVNHGTSDGKVAAQVTRQAGSSAEQGRKVHNRATWLVRIRKPHTWQVSHLQRVVFGAKVLGIDDITNDGENEIGETLLITCHEVSR